MRVYQRVSASGPLPCPGDSNEDPQRTTGYGYDVLVETPRYVDAPRVSLTEGLAEDGVVPRWGGTASYPEPLEGVTTYAVPGTEVDADNGDSPDPNPEHVRVTDLTDGLRVAWDGACAASQSRMSPRCGGCWSTVAGSWCRNVNVPAARLRALLTELAAVERCRRSGSSTPRVPNCAMMVLLQACACG